MMESAKATPLDVHRSGSYVGKLLVVEVHSDRAVATMIKRYRKRTIQVDDVVATRLQKLAEN